MACATGGRFDIVRRIGWAIGARCSEPIREAIDRGCYMATGEAKVIDNAVMDFMQQRQPAILGED